MGSIWDGESHQMMDVDHHSMEGANQLVKGGPPNKT